ncbi:MAG: 3'-5' exonuclease [Thermoguttaceae bacterium]
MTNQSPPKYLVFDIESVADAALVSKVHFGGAVSPEESVRKYRDELMAKNDSDFIPYTFQIPISVAIAKVAEDFSLIDVVVLDDPRFSPHEICSKFWRGWSAYKQPTLVSFNGRGFDIPLLELSAFRYGISIPAWFALKAKSYEQPRNRYNMRSHIDLCDILTNYGASRMTGGLNLAANILGKPGKIETQGNMVQDLFDAGELTRINDYCCCDVLDTYFVFLRTMLLTGEITLEDEQQLVQQAKEWIISQTDKRNAYQNYIDNWGDWQNPWESAASGQL